MEQRNEPTTEEIVNEARRVMSGSWGCAGCGMRTTLRQSTDRLESQQREIAELTAERDTEKARADAAELARDILAGIIKDMEEPKAFASSTFTIDGRGEKGKATE
ncbi:MAG: hypothetical protein VB062_04665 [Christensenella sp.]|nr:hypothetical protein [Christensenella sp.]